MPGPDTTLLLIGAATALAFFVGKLANRVHLPAVVGYIITGVALGPSLYTLFDVKPVFDKGLVSSMGIVSDIALALVAFTIGSELRSDILRKVGRGIITVMLYQSFLTFGLVTVAVYFLAGDWPTALLFGAVGVASAPAGTVVVLQEYRAKGPLTSSILAIVGLDDGLAIVIYAFAAAGARMLLLGSGDTVALMHIGTACLDIVGGIGLGVALGLALTLIGRRLRSRNDVLIVAVALVLLCAGLSNYLRVSLILSNLVFGMVAVNLSWKTGQRAYDALQSVSPPIYVLFFVLAGAHLDIVLLAAMGAIGAVYILSRIAGKMLGAYVGARAASVPDVIRKYLGLGTLSQAGVAIGLALLVMREFSGLGKAGQELATLLISTVAATTIVFEILGPVATKIAIQKADEIGKAVVKE
jgi:Kef-type K+ transport system membrane component KefB